MGKWFADWKAHGFEARTIVHVDMDAFFAQVEVLDEPSYASRPLIVGGPRVGSRGVVSTCSYEARRYGIHSAMPLRRAIELCPHAIVVPPRLSRYREVAAQVRRVLDKFTPIVEPLSIDEAFLDMTGCEHFYASPPDLGQRIKAAIRQATQLTASVGIAPNKFLAKLASDRQKPDGLVIVPSHAVDDFLADLPVRSLWGVGPQTSRLLEQVGIVTVKNLKEYSRERLIRFLGDNLGKHLWELAHGRDDRPVEPHTKAKSLGKETTFPTDIWDGPLLRSHLAHLVAETGWRLRRLGLYARTVTVKARYPNFETLTRSRTLSRAVHNDDALFRTAAEILDSLKLRQPLRLLGVYVSKFENIAQPSLFESDEKSDRLAEVMDGINMRFGSRVLRRGRERSDI